MRRWFGLVGMAVVGIFVFIGEGTASAKDIRFISKDRSPDLPIWAPSVVMIDEDKDLKEPLYFILENPTNTDHEFAVYGLFEIAPQQIAGTPKPEYYTGPKTESALRPIHVLIEAKGTLRIAVDTRELLGKRVVKPEYLFFCPRHMNAHPGGAIFIE